MRLISIATALFAALAVWLFLGSKETPARAAQAPQGPAISNAPATVAVPGTVSYTVNRGDSIPAIARHFLSRTSYLTSVELAEAIRVANGKSGNFVKP